jgi:hypothetical protein
MSVFGLALFGFFTDERLFGQYQLWPLTLTCG